MSALAGTVPPEAVNAKRIEMIRSGAVVFGVFLSGFVVREPSPYDLYMPVLMAVWALFGLRISRAIMPLLVLLIVFNIGGMISMTQLDELSWIPLYLCISLFLALTAVFFASVTESAPDLYPLIFKAWTWAAVLTSIIGILAYFNAFPGSEMFTLYGRAAGVFQDPNVFGPFLVLPGIYLLYLILTDRPGRVFLYVPPLLIIAGGVFFSFSRGAWGLFVLAASMLVVTVFVRSHSGKLRLRIVVMSIAAVALLTVALLVILQIPGVDQFFLTRAHIVQNYDTARLGRFARYPIGFLMATEQPFGIGPLEFGKMFGEDTHDIWLKALMDYSWLGFACYLTLVVWTLAAGFRILFRDRPWQPYLMCAYLALLGHIGLATIIDIDHWRHVYLLYGLVWGGIALESRYQRGTAPGQAAAPPVSLPAGNSLLAGR